MKNTVAILAFLGIITGISGCLKVSEDSDNPPGGGNPLDSLSVPADTSRMPQDTVPFDVDTIALRRDTVDFKNIPVATAGFAHIPELRYSRTKADSIATLAKKYVGTPYEYGSCEPGGFDCSGFIYYVFKSMGMELPRSSEAMAPVGREVALKQARKGDLIFFTGTEPGDKTVGHAGIVISDAGRPLEFIHSSSDKEENGVKITNYDESGYSKRFLKVTRVL
ncbi:MAG TPA: C40 family peptidase [Patescibacteria group bacterium]|nr:C40 family peptidase [Patescibacteria group bacterium]